MDAPESAESFLEFLKQSERDGLVTLLPPVPTAELARVPLGLVPLARVAAGFDVKGFEDDWGDGVFRWDQDMGASYFQGAESDAWHMDIGRDGCGNCWALLIEPETGEPREVLWSSHDPPVIMLAQPSLYSFCRLMISMPGTFIIATGREEGAIYCENPQGLSITDGLASDDPILRQLGAGLDDSWRIFDLRPGGRFRGYVSLATDATKKHPSAWVLAHQDTLPRVRKPWWKFW